MVDAALTGQAEEAKRVVVVGASGELDGAVVTHRDPRWFPDPERFDPERFLPAAKEARPRFAYFPFGGGPRVCIGEGFAWMEGVLVLAAIARRWRLRLVPDQRVVPAPSITLRPRNGISMVLERRG